MTDTKMLIEKAREIGFSDAAVMKRKDLTVRPEYRRFCEENLCGRYGKLPVCPPACGSVEKLTKDCEKYENALILQTEIPSGSINAQDAKTDNNLLTDKLITFLPEAGVTDYLRISAGPWKQWSCMSAYCIDAQKMADCVGMKCWADDGKNRFFTLILF